MQGRRFERDGNRGPGSGSRLSNGFTLIEVLAAVALLSIAFAIGLGALGKAARNASRGAALDSAVEHAQTLIAEQGLTAPLVNESRSGAFADGMHWTLHIHALPAATSGAVDGAALPTMPAGGAMLAQAAAIRLYQIDVAVDYGAGRTLRLATQRAQAVPEQRP